MTKYYKAWRDEQGNAHVEVRTDINKPGKPLTHIYVHCVEGNPFSWGYSGSGPADLALAILAHHYGERKQQVLAYWNRPLGGYKGKGSKAVDWHQDFKAAVVATWSRDGGFISDVEISKLMIEISEERKMSIDRSIPQDKLFGV